MLQVSLRRAQAQVAATSFLALFAIVGLALYGLPFFYDFMVRDFGWSRSASSWWDRCSVFWPGGWWTASAHAV
jgi:hypothetical protein